MKVIKLAQVPAPSVSVSATLKEAVPVMGSDQGCGVAVTDGDRLVGTLSRDKVMQKVIGEGLNPGSTRVGDVMSPAPDAVSPDTDAHEALQQMFSLKQCHLAIVDPEGKLKGWLGICNLFRDHVEDMKRELDSLESYFTADGPGG
jgi:predicted transcriptional regulator